MTIPPGVPAGIGTSTGVVTYTSLLQAEVPIDPRGRAFAGFDLLWQIGRLSLALIGLIATSSAYQPRTGPAARRSCSRA